MSKRIKSKNDKAWEAIFEKYEILSHIQEEGRFIISAEQIKEFREPRLMAKFDHSINVPQILSQNNLTILPISRRNYIISHFKVYHQFESTNKNIIRATLPSHLQSLDSKNIINESIAINCAFASGILSDFLEEDDIYSTVSGRMSSGSFDFLIHNTLSDNLEKIYVNNSQIEIDAAFEGDRSLSLIEAKRDLSEDFLVRQLYYPYRVWSEHVTKKVRPIFLIYSNGIFSLYEYKFQNLNCYDSLILIKHKNYSIEDTTISLSDLQQIVHQIQLVSEPSIPFPQADCFERVINICELLHLQKMNREQLTEQYAFDIRQTNYYTDAARYLGLINKQYDKDHKPLYSLSKLGKEIISLPYKQRQLAFCKIILQHRVFNEIFLLCLDTGTLPDNSKIVEIMQKANLYNVGKISTYKRRSSTITGWINWILNLIDE